MSLPSQEYLVSRLDYNPETGILIWKHKSDSPGWNARFAGTIAGAKYKAGIALHIGGERHRAHRVIWKLVTGKEPPEVIDHANRNPWDNRWANLRAATRSENGMNRPALGASKCKNGRWRAAIHLQYKKIHLGYFDSLHDARDAYRIASEQYHNQFACIETPA